MRIFIAVIVFIFGVQSWTQADDIRDFEIEGFSIGDSLLDHFSKQKIDEEKYFEAEQGDNKEVARFYIREILKHWTFRNLKYFLLKLRKS